MKESERDIKREEEREGRQNDFLSYFSTKFKKKYSIIVCTIIILEFKLKFNDTSS